MISPFYGEFLVSPAATQCVLNYCSHKCAYCFANLNNPGRRSDVPKAMRQIGNIFTRDNLESRLMRSGAPVLFSNLVDPFASVNRRLSVPMMSVLSEIGVPVMVQTRGGEGAMDTARLLPPSVWYVSVAFRDEDLRRRLEPGAPSIESRFVLMRDLVALGHTVMVGMLPLYEGWEESPEEIISLAADAGAVGAWVGRYHLTVNQIKNLSRAEYEVLEPTFLDARRKRHSAWYLDAVDRIEKRADSRGMFVKSGMSSRGGMGYARTMRAVYPSAAPMFDEFDDWCRDNPREWYTFDDFLSVVYPWVRDADTAPFHYGSYLRAVTVGSWYEGQATSRSTFGTFRDLLRTIWNGPYMKNGPYGSPRFSAIVEDDPNGKEYTNICDDEGNDLFLYSAEGTSEPTTDYREAGIEDLIEEEYEHA